MKKEFTATTLQKAEKAFNEILHLEKGHYYVAAGGDFVPHPVVFKYLGVQDNSEYNLSTDYWNEYVRKYNTYSLNVEILKGEGYHNTFPNLFMCYAICSYNNYKKGRFGKYVPENCRQIYHKDIKQEFDRMFGKCMDCTELIHTKASLEASNRRLGAIKMVSEKVFNNNEFMMRSLRKEQEINNKLRRKLANIKNSLQEGIGTI